MSRSQKNPVIVRSVVDQGLSIAQAAAKLGVSRQWVHQLVQRYRCGGVTEVLPQSKAPKSRPHTTTEAVRARIIALRQALVADGADAGPETIAWHLEREGFQVPSTSTIQRSLRAAGLVTPQPKKRPKSSYLRFQAELPNGCWQADITYWFLADGTRVEILDFLDDHSRLLLTIQAKALWTSADVVAVMDQSISTYGPPAATLTDNGMVFTARFTARPGVKNGFEKLLAAHQIQQRNGAPSHPQTQGKIERFHQTLKRWLGARALPDSLEQLQGLLDVFAHWYDTDRPHRALNRRTPSQAYTALPKATPKTTAEPEYRTRTDKCL
ncbi:MAG: IS481 family transposase [Yaniella sp.]|uniref:IS481 family transposase n=2 Tax=Yaniella sp. TaxID=2773929 RepID=UPI0026487AD2|nr:IS481 family transposase [Yaniella sp.]MDN5732458.1 IS481 family transposase [Yaniella sp.]MDN5817823.1 IS481 family transposase [Yaniella sp.]MDN6457571.1 IS481 family transposase [Yaniella sp.]